MVDYGLKVSLPGKDVSSTDKRDFVFNSDNEFNIKIVKQGGGSVTVAAGGFADITIAHNLNFIPLSMLFIQSNPDSNIWRFGCHFNNGADAAIDQDGNNTYVDATNLHFRIRNGFAAQKTIAYYYYIFGDSAS